MKKTDGAGSITNLVEHLREELRVAKGRIEYLEYCLESGHNPGPMAAPVPPKKSSPPKK